MINLSPDSFIFRTTIRYAFFFINFFALYLLLRGHNLPGGGFIAGLVTAISLVLLSMAVGLQEIHRITRVDPVRVASFGLFVAAGTAFLPALFGSQFFEHADVHLYDLPLLGEVHLGTTLLFDAGVFLVVVGVVSKLIFVMMYSTQGHRAFVEEEERLYSSLLEGQIEDEHSRMEPEIFEEKETDAT
jgi:multicomponent Na+:H+ antiporter subunit B